MLSDYASERVFDGTRVMRVDRREALQRAYDRSRSAPHVLLSDNLHRHEQAVALIFEGLRQHYLECLQSGRLTDWANAAHASVDLLACANGIKFVRRNSDKD